MGPGHSGKNAVVHWLMRNNKESYVVWIDCKIWSTDASFLKQLLNELGSFM